MNSSELGITVAVVNIIIVLVVVGWCNHKIKELTDKDNWK